MAAVVVVIILAVVVAGAALKRVICEQSIWLITTPSLSMVIGFALAARSRSQSAQSMPSPVAAKGSKTKRRKDVHVETNVCLSSSYPRDRLG